MTIPTVLFLLIAPRDALVPGAMDVGMELNSLSKSFNMAGWRVGMVLGNKENIKALLKVKK